MAKEMMIVFVYDTCLVTSEDQDPTSAVLYFHPGWVSDVQRHSLCGQLVGTAHCVGSLLAAPTMITLQSGKFIIKHYGRYLLAIGSDRNIPDWVLKGRARLLTDLIRVYHGDLIAVSSLFPDEKRLSEKLYQMLETYIPVLQFGCHIFQRVPMLSLPKSATSTWMEAMQVLEHCRKLRGSLGGFILYNNKIVASQLSPALTSRLAVVEPHRVKSPAEVVVTSAPPPIGTQLLLVYVSRKTYRQLSGVVKLDSIHKYAKNQEAEREKTSKEFIGGMKRDKSLLFTAVPEEDQNLLSPPLTSSDPPNGAMTQPMPDMVPFTNKPRPRPNKLSLSFKTQMSVEEEPKELDKVFTGQTSVCSTPMIEYKRLHGNVLSICQNPDNQIDIDVKPPPDIINEIKIQKLEDTDMLPNRLNTVGQHFVPKPASGRKLASMEDLQEAIKRISSRAVAKFRPRRPTCDSPESPQKNHTQTINDPSFPIFRSDGVEISESLYKDYIEQYNAEIEHGPFDDNMFTFNKKVYEKELEGFDTERAPSPHVTPKKAPLESKPQDQSRRKSLSLPLKSLSDSATEGPGRRRPSGVQLTPLMEKLSHLAFSDKSSGYSSRLTTPVEMKEFTPYAEKAQGMRCNRPQECEEGSSDSDCDDEAGDYSHNSDKCALFIHSLHNTALMMLLRLDVADDTQLVTQLWETSLNTLGSIEQQCLEPLPVKTDSSDYSYLVLDSDWGTVHKGGPWTSQDIATMGLAHDELEDKQLSQLVLRSDQSCLLATQCGGTQVYYSESSASKPGPPPPSDLLATVQLKAKRRLHRDHAIVIV